MKNRVHHEKQGLSEKNRVYQKKTGFIREKQGLSEKNRVYHEKQGFSEKVVRGHQDRGLPSHSRRMLHPTTE